MLLRLWGSEIMQVISFLWYHMWASFSLYSNNGVVYARHNVTMYGVTCPRIEGRRLVARGCLVLNISCGRRNLGWSVDVGVAHIKHRRSNEKEVENEVE